MAKQKENAVVASQEQLADGIYSMWIQTQAADTAKPGQFISMYTTDGSKLLPRPISICEIDRTRGMLRVVYRVTGENTGTEQFSKLKSGDTIPVIGPLGNGFPYEKAEGKKVFLMGGGIGVPPILELAKQMQCEKKQIVAGYRDAQTFLKEEFEANGELYISTEDGSVGTKGNVMDAIRENETGSRHDLCVRTNADAACDQAVRRRAGNRMLHFPGRENGVRYRCLSGVRLQVKRKGCPQ